MKADMKKILGSYTLVFTVLDDTTPNLPIMRCALIVMASVISMVECYTRKCE